MNLKASPAAIGAFIIGSVMIFIALVIFFGSGSLFKDVARYVLYFDGSLQGLRPGAPVSMRGVEIGEVKRIRLNVYRQQGVEILTEVIIEVDNERYYQVDDTEQGSSVDQLIEDGMRAQLRTQSLLTGLLNIEFGFYPGTVVNLKNLGSSPYLELPTIPTELEVFTRQLEKMDLDKMRGNLENILQGMDELVNHPDNFLLLKNMDKALVDIQSLANSLESDIAELQQDVGPLLRNTNTLVEGLNKQLPETVANLNASLEQLERTGQGAEFILSDDSPLMYELIQATQSIGDAADQMRALSQTLENKPESILKGK